MIRTHILGIRLLLLLCTCGCLTGCGTLKPEVEEIQTKEIVVELDGQTLEHIVYPIYIEESGNVMIPVSGLEDTFSCVVQSYQDEAYIIRKNTLSLELNRSRGEIVRTGDIPYVSVKLVAEALGYSVSWNQEEQRLSLTNEYPDRKLLPDVYDYRKEGRAPQVKNQGTLGTCWSFASLMALETSLLPFENLDFSEDHMTLKNSFALPQQAGGEYTMALAYLLAWQGPVFEKDDPYGDNVSPENLEAVKHLQEVRILEKKDYDSIKKAVFKFGGVQSSLYTSMQDYSSRSSYYNRNLFSYCYKGSEPPNHDVVIVGWDDHYPKENFETPVSGDGAFLCINSWGEEFGENGYFYVSYYDTNIGVYNITYSRAEETDNYDKIYQTDLCGWIGQLGYGREDVYFANVYQAGESESIAAAGFYAIGPQSSYEVYVARNVSDKNSLNQRELVTEGTLEEAGFYTISFTNTISLEDGERFAVIVKMTTPGAVHPAAIEYQADENKANVDITDGEGYISLHGDIWENVEQAQNCNICLKAYTIAK